MKSLRFQKYSPYRNGFVLWVLVTLLLSILGSVSGLILPLAALVGFNAAAFMLMLFDKLAAHAENRRIPEAVLLLALAFGLVGGLLGMTLFRHKTKKSSFQLWVIAIVLLEIAAILWFFKSIFMIDTSPSAL